MRGAAHGPHPLPADIIARLHERLDGYDLPTCTDAAQLRRYLNRLRCANHRGTFAASEVLRILSVYEVADLPRRVPACSVLSACRRGGKRRQA